MAAIILVVCGGVYMQRDNDLLQDAVFHTNEQNPSVSSNAQRTQRQKDAVEDIVREPIGRGPGTAGPASIYLEDSEARVAENYYLQLGQEIGVIGLGIFLAIFVLLCKRLWELKSYPWPKAILLAGIGLAVANLLLHVWADDTLAIIWFGVAGYFAFLPRRSQPRAVY